MSLSSKTPRARIEGLGSAKTGTRDFWVQRVTAMALIPLTIAFVFVVVSLVRADQATAIARLSSPVVAVLMLLFIAAGIVHMRIGMQVIIEDYVHQEDLKIGCVMANSFFAYLLGALSIYALLKLNFGI